MTPSNLGPFQLIANWPVMAGASIVAFVSWLIHYRRYRAMADVPSARIATAPQGYVELVGIGRAIGGLPLYSPATGLPCLWYEYVIEEQWGDRDNNWREVHRERSDASFIIDDGSGHCVVDAEGADIITAQRSVNVEYGQRTTLRVLIPGTRLYALGHLATESGASRRPTIKAAMNDRLTEWKRDGTAQKKFDLDGNGELSLEEWELARNAARREVSLEWAEGGALPDAHSLGPSPDGRWFMVSDIAPDTMVRQYRLKAWGSLAAFFAALAFAVWAYNGF
ncbi:MAG: hypothetical protein QM803_11095 [Rhodocyclaceae bacterium]